MREMGKAVLLVIMWLAFAGNVALALFLFARVLSGLVSRLRARVRGEAHANRPEGQANVIPEPWTRRIVGAGSKTRTRREVEAHTDEVSCKARAA